MTPVESAEAIWRQLDDYCSRESYEGWDPFDGLLSPVFGSSPLRHSRVARLAFLQLLKRSAVNLRRPLRVPKHANAKALALFSRSYALKGDGAGQRHLLERMLALRVDADLWGQAAWGYPFAWQARAFYVPSGTPNVIATAYCVRAMIAAETSLGLDFSELRVAAGRFVLSHLAREDGGQRYLAYVPGESALVHNASLWGAWLLLQAAEVGAADALRSYAEDVIDAALDCQRDDGSWIYGARGHHQFIDGFHLGYILESLDLSARLLDEAPRVRASIRRGLEFYERELFLPDGTPKYYATRTYPIDCHCAAQALPTLLAIEPTPDRRALADRVLAWTVQNMWCQRESRFLYQRHRLWSNRTPYLRWTQAWMHLAISTYINAGTRAASPA